MKKELVPTTEKAFDYLGEAQGLLDNAIREMEAKGVPTLRKVYQLDDGKCTVICQCGTLLSRAIIIADALNGFLFRPHATDSYPLDDLAGNEELKTRFVEFDEQWAYTADPPANFGNVDWKGLNEDVLTWKGPYSRHFGFDPKTYIQGYTVSDDDSVLQQYFTVFTPNVYAEGEVLATAPDNKRVLGAAYRDDVLQVIVSGNYRDAINPDGTSGGFYVEAYEVVDNAWKRTAYTTGPRPLTCWFFSPDGTQAIGQSNLGLTSYSNGTFTRLEAGNSFSTIVTGSGTSAPVADSAETCPECTEAATIGGIEISNKISIEHHGDMIVAAEFDLTGAVKTAIASVNALTVATNHYRSQGFIAKSYVVPDDPLQSSEPVPSMTLVYEDQVSAYASYRYACNCKLTKVSGGNAFIDSTGKIQFDPNKCGGPFTATAECDGGVVLTAYGKSASVGSMSITGNVFPNILQPYDTIAVNGGVLPITLTKTGNMVSSLSKTGDRTWQVNIDACVSHPNESPMGTFTAVDACGTSVTVTWVVNWQYVPDGAATVEYNGYNGACYTNYNCPTGQIKCFNDSIIMSGNYVMGMPVGNYAMSLGLESFQVTTYNGTKLTGFTYDGYACFANAQCSPGWNNPPGCGSWGDATWGTYSKYTGTYVLRCL